MIQNIKTVNILKLFIVFALSLFISSVQGVFAFTQPAPTVTWTPSSNPVDLSGSGLLTLSYTAIGATNCFDQAVFEADGVTSAAPIVGFGLVVPHGATSYTFFNIPVDRDLVFSIQCVNGDSKVTTETIAIGTFYSSPPLVPSVDITASPNPVTINPTGNVTITVDAKNIDFCDLRSSSDPLTGWTTAVPVSGNAITIRNVAISGDTTFIADCYNLMPGNDQVIDTVTVTTVAPPPAQSVVVSASPANPVALGPTANITVTVDADNSDFCDLRSSADPLVGWTTTVPVSGNAVTVRNVTISGDTDFTADCYKLSPGNDPISDTFTVTTTAAPTFDIFAAAPSLSINSATPVGVSGTYDNLDALLLIGKIGLPGLDPAGDGVTYRASLGAVPLRSIAIDLSPVATYSGGISAGAQPTSQEFSTALTRTFNGVPFGDRELCARVNLDGPPTEFETNLDTTNNTNCVNVTIPVPRPPMSITTDRQVVRVGDSVDISWDVDITYVLNCTVTGAGGVNTSFSTPAAGSSITTSALNSTSKFVLQCNEPITNTTFTEELTVEVIPESAEI